ncbi:MAG: hypothetical protein ACR2G3_09470 [Solirubrobacterales bacterium]
MALDLDTYRQGAETFVSELDREYYLHLAGHKPSLEIEAIYGAHSSLFDRSVVAAIREEAGAVKPGGDEERRLRCLLSFALDGLLGRETRGEAEEGARLEATLVVDAGHGAIPFRQVPIEQANEPDPARRAALEAARDALLAEHLNPLHRAAMERSHALCHDLGWASYADAYAEVRGIDLDRLAGQTRAFLAATDETYPELVDPRLDGAGLPPLGRLARSDVPRFFRSAELDPFFPADSLVGSLERTLGGLGVDLRAQSNVHLDTEPRATKSPRAFCSPVRVPGEVYLVIAPVGGRDDFAALFHEAGHTEHYANTAAGNPFEFRHLGDNSVTESFAFLLEHLTEDPVWLGDVLGMADPSAAIAQARASRLVLLRRYAAKITYELDLHGADPDLAEMPARYAEVLGSATRIRWPEAAFLSDVDAGFYVASYLRAWALETHWRRALRERFGDRWYSSEEAGRWLLGLWAHGQRLDADELLAEELGSELDFADVAAEVAEWTAG